MIATDYIQEGQEVYFIIYDSNDNNSYRKLPVILKGRIIVPFHPCDANETIVRWTDGPWNYNREHHVGYLRRGGDFNVDKEDLFLTFEGAALSIKRLIAERGYDEIDDYKKGIKNLQDLLEFPIKYNFFTDDEDSDKKKSKLIQAYEERAFELTGFKV